VPQKQRAGSFVMGVAPVTQCHPERDIDKDHL
jgi:hypothetical protein